MLIRARLARAGFFLAALLFVAGCPSSGNPNLPADISGKVTYNGNVVGGGTITLIAADGAENQAPIGADGSYVFPTMPEGTMTVTIETESINKRKEEYKGGSGASGGAASKYGKSAPKSSPVKGKGAENSPAPEGANIVTPTYVKIPAKYSDKTTSGLTVTLKKGSQTHNFQLTD